ncbi:MAG: tetratricopeptide repeat protein, partial [Deltaproteobacteria bacterium]|nr:tetratricopeptide repeat protein [Deltaproteobacteria bacterium]
MMTETTSTSSERPLAGGAYVDEKFLDYLSSAADLVAAHRFDEAEVEVLRALSVAHADVRALKLLALVQFKLGRLDEARVVCGDIAAALPGDAGIHVKLGLIALKLDRIDEAVQELELSTRLAPDDLRAWNYLGFA